MTVGQEQSADETTAQKPLVKGDLPQVSLRCTALVAPGYAPCAGAHRHAPLPSTVTRAVVTVEIRPIIVTLQDAHVERGTIFLCGMADRMATCVTSAGYSVGVI